MASYKGLVIVSWVFARGRVHTVSAAPATATQHVQEEIASAMVSQFRCGLQFFYVEEKPFLVEGIDLKIVARCRYDWCPNARENFQSRMCSDVQTYKNILLPRYR